MVGGAISGYCAMGSVESAMTPTSVMTMLITPAKIGRSMKKCGKFMKSEVGSGISELFAPTPGNHARLVNVTLLRGIDGRDDDCNQFIGFFFERRKSFRRDDPGFFKQFEPEQRFIGLFFDIAEFGEKVRSGFCAASGAVICGHDVPDRTSCVASARADVVFGKADRKSTRLNSSHTVISYAVFC